MDAYNLGMRSEPFISTAGYSICWELEVKFDTKHFSASESRLISVFHLSPSKASINLFFLRHVVRRSDSSNMPSTRQTRNAVPKTLKRKKADTESDDEDQGDAFETSSEDDEVALDSDNLDDDEEEVTVKKSKKRSPSKSKPTPKKTPSKKRRKKAADSEEELELEEGQQVVGAIVRAPTTGLGDLLSHSNAHSR